MSYISSLKTKLDTVLIPEWRTAYRLFSVQASTIFSASSLGWMALDDSQKASILNAIGLNGPAALALAGFVLIIIARLKAQKAAAAVVAP